MVVAYTLREEELFLDAALPVFAGVHVLTGVEDNHSHDFLEVAVVADGSGRHVTARGSRRTVAGDVFILRPGAWHGFADCRGLVVANACVSTSALSGDLAFLSDLPTLRHLLWTGPIAPGRRGVLEHHVDRDLAQEAAEELDLLATALAERPHTWVSLLGRLLTAFGALTHADDQDRSGTDLPPPVRAVVDRLERHPEHQWRLTELGNIGGVDPAYLSRLFHHHLGLPPIAYLARLRAEKAATLLARSTMSAARIGALVGWPDPTYFTRRFRAVHGVTPTEYRRTSRHAVAGGTHHPRWMSGAVNRP